MKKILYVLPFCFLFFTACKDKGVDDRDLDTYADWMTQFMIDHAEQVTLKNMSLPGAHDAGIYTLSSCTLGANSCSTQTQDIDMKSMLEAGVRYYDIRPTLNDTGEYFTEHSTECEGLGCQGDALNNILTQTKEFLDNHSELVVFVMTHFCKTSYDDTGMTDMVKNIMGERLYTENSTSRTHLLNEPLQNILDLDGAKGKLLLVYEDAPDNSDLRTKGIFPASFLPLQGSYANSFDFETMKADQLEKFNNYDPTNERIFEMSWTMTLNVELSISCVFPENNPQSIQDFAEPTNDLLISSMRGWMNDGTISNGKIPNIIWVDFADTFVTDACREISEQNF